MPAILALGLATALGPEQPTYAQSPVSGAKRIEHQTALPQRDGALLPRLTGYRAPTIQQKVNLHLADLEASLACDTVEPPGESHSYESQVKVTYAANDVLSISVHSDYYCGGPHPENDENNSVTFDLETGLPVSFDQLFANYGRDAEAIVRELFPERIARAERLAAAGGEHKEDCDDPFIFSVLHLVASGFSYAISEEGLLVQPDFPFVMRACAEEVVVPFKRVHRFAAPGGILARVTAAEASRSTSE
ncbi:MAG TPA: hypothetical protein VF017_19060 [Thermoanaerobaculia bacterium]|nr:hypothetical protein [Thermoanaerobaculia bacterium]